MRREEIQSRENSAAVESAGGNGKILLVQFIFTATTPLRGANLSGLTSTL